jgi:hypothetical protein
MNDLYEFVCANIRANCPGVNSYAHQSGTYDITLFKGSIPPDDGQESMGTFTEQQSGYFVASSEMDSKEDAGEYAGQLL